ncbi:MAG: hypothetical protein EA396_07710 [Anaerolineaceae bacterium]|nr:MAG: hypothetical protein EA396_07710 [Anaerolineaceae bacterium]
MFKLSHNVIAHAELKHQHYVINQNRHSILWIMLALSMIIPGVLLSLVALVLAALDLDAGRWALLASPTWAMAVSVGGLSLLVMNLALYVVVMLTALALAYNSITRERQNNTWDILMLTNVDAALLVRGKWWACLRAMWGDYLLLLLLRVGMACVLIVGVDSVRGGVGLVALIALIITAFTLVDVGFTIALAIASGVTDVSANVSGPVMLAVRLVAILIAGGAYGLMLFFIVIDQINVMILLGICVIGVYGIITWLTLSAARRLAIRRGLLPSRR